MTDSQLLEVAAEARQRAYAPYSEFQVGAALLCASGKIYSGCNVENASYGLTICAERVAIGTAVSEGEKSFARMAISLSGGGSPCGACRQVINEFCSPEFRVLMGDEAGELVREMTIGELLPESFGPQSL